jgi:hypothetical protein
MHIRTIVSNRCKSPFQLSVLFTEYRPRWIRTLLWNVLTAHNLSLEGCRQSNTFASSMCQLSFVLWYRQPTSHHKTPYLAEPATPRVRTSTTRIVTQSVPVQVFLICKKVHQEVKHHLTQRLASCQRLQFIVDSASLRSFITQYLITGERAGEGILPRIMSNPRVTRQFPGVPFNERCLIPATRGRLVPSPLLA